MSVRRVPNALGCHGILAFLIGQCCNSISAEVEVRLCIVQDCLGACGYRSLEEGVGVMDLGRVCGRTWLVRCFKKQRLDGDQHYEWSNFLYPVDRREAPSEMGRKVAFVLHNRQHIVAKRY